MLYFILIDNVKQVMRFPQTGIDEAIYLHTELSEQLLERLCKSASEKNPITDLTLSLFDPYFTRLRSARFINANNLTIDGLKILRGHNIIELEIRGLANATISDVVDECLGEYIKSLMANKLFAPNFGPLSIYILY